MWTLARRHCALSTRQMTTVKGPQFIEQFQKFEISIAKKISKNKSYFISMKTLDYRSHHPL